MDSTNANSCTLFSLRQRANNQYYLPQIERETDNSIELFLLIFLHVNEKWKSYYCKHNVTRTVSLVPPSRNVVTYLLNSKRDKGLRTQRYLRAWPDYSPNRAVIFEIPLITRNHVRTPTDSYMYLSPQTFSQTISHNLFYYTIWSILNLWLRRVLTHNRILILFKYKNLWTYEMTPPVKCSLDSTNVSS